MKESDILFESGDYWVIKSKRAYTVLKAGLTHSHAVQDFAPNEDGLSLAIAFATYKAKRSSNVNHS